MHEESEITQLRSHVARLERRFVHLRSAVLIAVGIVFGLAFMGAHPRRDITVTRLALVDNSGEERAVLAMTANGPRLMIHGEKHEGRAALGAPGLFIFDSSGVSRIAISLLDDGAAGASFFDETGKAGMGFDVNKVEKGLMFLDANGGQQAAFVVAGDRRELFVNDEVGTGRASFGLIGKVPVVSFADQNGKVRAGLLIDNGSPRLTLNDSQQRGRVSVAVTEQGGTVVFADDGGKVVRKLP